MIEALYDELNNLSIEDIEKNIGLFTKNVIKNLKTEKFSLTTNNHFNISIKQNKEKINVITSLKIYDMSNNIKSIHMYNNEKIDYLFYTFNLASNLSNLFGLKHKNKVVNYLNKKLDINKQCKIEPFVNILKCISKNFILINDDIQNYVLSFISGFEGQIKEQYAHQLINGRIINLPLFVIQNNVNFYITKYDDTINENFIIEYEGCYFDKLYSTETKTIINISNINIQKHILKSYKDTNIILYIKPKISQKYINLIDGINIYPFEEQKNGWWIFNLQNKNINLCNIFIRSSVNVFKMDLMIKRKILINVEKIVMNENINY